MFTPPKKVGGPEIGAAHKSQKVGGPRPARPNRLRGFIEFWQPRKAGLNFQTIYCQYYEWHADVHFHTT